MSEVERLVRVETELTAHFKSDDERYGRIEANTARIMNGIDSLSTDMKGAVTRIHKRVDDEVKDRNKDTASLRGKIAGLKIWFLSGAATLLLGSVVFAGKVIVASMGGE